MSAKLQDEEDQYFTCYNKQEVTDLLYYFINNQVRLEGFQKRSNHPFDNYYPELLIEDYNPVHGELKIICTNLQVKHSDFQKHIPLRLSTVSNRFNFNVKINLIGGDFILVSAPKIYDYRVQKISRRLELENMPNKNLIFSFEKNNFNGQITNISETGLAFKIQTDFKLNENDTLTLHSLMDKKLPTTIQAKIIYINTDSSDTLTIGINFFDEINIEHFLNNSNFF